MKYKNQKLINAFNLINYHYDLLKKEENKNNRIKVLLKNLRNKNEQLRKKVIKSTNHNNCVLQNSQNIFQAIVELKNKLDFENDNVKRKQIIASMRTLLNFINAKTTPLDMAFFINNSDILEKIGINFTFKGLDVILLLNNGYKLRYEKEYFITMESGKIIKHYPNLGSNNSSTVRKNAGHASFNSFISKTFILENSNPNKMNFSQNIQNILDQLLYSNKYMNGYLLSDNNEIIKMHNNTIFTTDFEEEIKFTVKDDEIFKINSNGELIKLQRSKASIDDIINIS